MVHMRVLANRSEWLKHRKNYIGGSDASSILGLNPWRSNVELWQEKTGAVESADISSKPYVQYGIAAEPILRELFKLNYPQYRMEYVENWSHVNDRIPWAAASLDGELTEIATGRKGIWECKTTEIVSSMSKEKWAGKLPDNYFCQLLHYLMVREDCEFAHLTALLTFKHDEKELYQQIKNYHIERHEVQDQIDYLMEEEKKFWLDTKQGRCPALILPEI